MHTQYYTGILHRGYLMTKRKYTGNILVIGDTHIPYERDGYLDFCLDVQREYKCDHVFHAGDFADWHGISYHENEEDALKSKDELILTRKKAISWGKAFKEMAITIGNHDALIARNAKTHGLPIDIFKPMNDILETPYTWKWGMKFIFNNVLFTHGTGFSGKYPHATAMTNHRSNVVIGHCHSVSGVAHSATYHDIIWGMCVGCGIDDSCPAFNYGRGLAKRSIISCGVILENGRIPLTITMPL